ncbi:MAG: aspartate kinase [Chitinispirillales bacterium]|jgi:aspartate kinase|nr:aspartate kinase [Chitinispirillales bacterium]
MPSIVCKFGGTSVATKEKIEQIIDIIKLNPDRNAVVLSAPGKANGINTKVTDYLISIVEKSLAQKDIDRDIAGVKERYYDIYEPLGLSKETIDGVLIRLDKRIAADKSDKGRYRDAIVASGEDLNTELFAIYAASVGIKAKFVSPVDVELIVTDNFGDAMITKEGSANLIKLRDYISDGYVVVFPGFFGVSTKGDIVTFSRGGSDLSGALVADAIDAYEYENWTDVNGILSANPKTIANPEQIKALTYKEMRELSYMGFSVFHEEAVKPVMKKKIPIRLRNTDNLENTGTLIVSGRLPHNREIVGIAAASGFCSFNLQKFLMNREKGFGRKLLEIFEDLGISYEHCPSGVDNISVILDQKQLRPESVNNIVRRIEKELKPDELKTEFGLSLVAVVGEGLMHKIGVLSSAASALSKAGVNIKIVNQGSSELSIIFGIDGADEVRAVKVLYDAFFS